MASCATQIITAMVVGLVLFVSLLAILLMSGTPDVQCWRCNGKDCVLAPGRYRTCNIGAGLYPSSDCGNGCATDQVFTAPNITWAQPSNDVPVDESPNVYCAAIPGNCRRTICVLKDGVDPSTLDDAEFKVCDDCDFCPRKMRVDGEHKPQTVYLDRNKRTNTDDGTDNMNGPGPDNMGMGPMGPGPMAPMGPLGMGANYNR